MRTDAAESGRCVAARCGAALTVAHLDAVRRVGGASFLGAVAPREDARDAVARLGRPADAIRRGAGSSCATGAGGSVGRRRGLLRSASAAAEEAFRLSTLAGAGGAAPEETAALTRAMRGALTFAAGTTASTLSLGTFRGLPTFRGCPATELPTGAAALLLSTRGAGPGGSARRKEAAARGSAANKSSGATTNPDTSTCPSPAVSLLRPLLRLPPAAADCEALPPDPFAAEAALLRRLRFEGLAAPRSAEPDRRSPPLPPAASSEGAADTDVAVAAAAGAAPTAASPNRSLALASGRPCCEANVGVSASSLSQ